MKSKLSKTLLATAMALPTAGFVWWYVDRPGHVSTHGNATFAAAPAPNGQAGKPPVEPTATDWNMWGRTPDRNMVSHEKNPPTNWDVDKGTNIKWSAQLGTQSYGTPVIAGGFVFVGTNNENKRDPKFVDDAGVLMGFAEADGKFLFQRLSAKLKAGRVNDWPYMGNCSAAYVESDRLWYTTSRCETVCLDISPLKTGGQPKDLWAVDMMAKYGVFPHNMTSSSILAHGDLIYVITGNGVDNTHKNVPSPKAPSVICFDKNTGKMVWSDNSPGENILHGQWSSPALADANGRMLLIAPLGNGWIYAYDAKTGEKVWWFDSNDKNTVYPATRNELVATPVVVGNLLYIANGQDPEHGEGPGHLWCIDITKKGDVSAQLLDEPAAEKPKPGDELVGDVMPVRTKANPNSAVVWDYAAQDRDGNKRIEGSERVNRTISNVTIYNGLAFCPDFSGFLHCFDAKTGKHHWTHDMESAMWGSPLAIDGKIYLGDEEGDIAIFEASKDLKVLATIPMGTAVYSSPVFSNGTLYIMTKEKLYAIGEKK